MNATSKIQRIIKWLIILGVIALVATVVVKTVLWETRPRTLVTVGGLVYRADVADTDALRTKGLSGRSGIGSDEAMLFLFDRDGSWPIWMKDMKFPIDIIWINSKNKIVHIERNVEPDGEPHTQYRSEEPARYVLEVASGQVKQANISVGQSVKFNILDNSR